MKKIDIKQVIVKGEEDIWHYRITDTIRTSLQGPNILSDEVIGELMTEELGRNCLGREYNVACRTTLTESERRRGPL